MDANEDPNIFDIHADDNDAFLTAEVAAETVKSDKPNAKSKKISIDEYRKLKIENEQLKKKMGLSSPEQPEIDNNPEEDDEDECEDIESEEDDDDAAPVSPRKNSSDHEDISEKEQLSKDLSKDLINISTDEDEGDHLNEEMEDPDDDKLNRARLSPIEWSEDEIEQDDEGLDEDNEEGEDDEPVVKVKSTSEKKIQSIAERRESAVKPEQGRASPPPTLPTEIKYLFKETRYFMIKSNNHDNVRLAKQHSIWATPRSNEYRLNRAFAETRNVLLIFSVKESGHFQGYARLAAISSNNEVVNWVLPPGLPLWQLSGGFKIDWISQSDLPFSKTTNLINAWNERKPVKIGRDGQEITPACGESLCRLFQIDKECPLDDIIDKAKKTKRDPKLLSQIERKKRESGRPSHFTGGFNNQAGHSRRRDDRYQQRGRDPSFPMVNPDIFINGNYQDYIHQAQQLSRREYQYHQMSYPMYPEHMPSYESSRFYSGGHGSRDREKRYEDRVNDFLRGIDNRESGHRVDHLPPRGHDRNYSPPPSPPPMLSGRRSRSPRDTYYKQLRHMRDRERSPQIPMGYSRSRSRERR